MCGGRGASRWLLPGGQPGLPAALPARGRGGRIEVAVAWRRARELHQLRRGISPRRGRGPDALASLPGPGVALVRRWCAHRVPADARGPGPGGMRYRARYLSIADRGGARPSAGKGTRSGRPAPPLPGRPDVGVVWYGWPSPVLSPPWPGRAVALRHRRAARASRDRAGMARPGWGRPGIVSCLGVPLPVRACPAPGSLGCQGARDLAGWPRGIPGAAAWPGRVARWAASVPLRAAVSPHRSLEPCPDFFESWRSSWSPVTESNRRSSPYHACQFRLTRSHQV